MVSVDLHCCSSIAIQGRVAGGRGPWLSTFSKSSDFRRKLLDFAVGKEKGFEFYL